MLQAYQMRGFPKQLSGEIKSGFQTRSREHLDHRGKAALNQFPFRLRAEFARFAALNHKSSIDKVSAHERTVTWNRSHSQYRSTAARKLCGIAHSLILQSTDNKRRSHRVGSRKQNYGVQTRDCA